MAANGVTLVSTLSVFPSWEAFARTTSIDRFTTAEGRERVAKRKESAYASLAAATRAGVRIATGTDFGGGSVRAGFLAGEVELLVDAGLEPHDALAAATWRAGELLGVITPGVSKRGCRPISCSSRAIRCLTRARCGACGRSTSAVCAWPDPALGVGGQCYRRWPAVPKRRSSSRSSTSASAMASSR